ncbi:MAG: hypothetical protein K6T78_12540 [Alicyclobacillus sp.]|nr:hypothetical protein [Alicyclobacillus sp.]
MPNRLQQHRVRKPGRVGRCLAGLAAAVCATAMVSVAPVRTSADVPASTDFGQDAYVPALQAPTGGWCRAVFVTLYPDGRSAAEVRTVRNDAENTFAGDHPGWYRDDRLTWFVQMPVYVRQLTGEPSDPGASAV